MPTPILECAFSTDPLSSSPVWADITGYLREFSVRRGRQGDLGRWEAGTASFTLSNTDRRFEPYYSASPYSPNVIPRRRIRLRAQVQGQYLDLPGTTGNYAWAPDSAGVSVTGDIDIRCKVALDDWTPASTMVVLAKRHDATNQRSYGLSVTATTGTLGFQSSSAGTSLTVDVVSTAATGVADGATKWVRATLDVDNGAAGKTVTFYTSSDYDPASNTGTWTQLGTPVTSATTTSIFNSTARLTVGARSDDGSAGMLAGNVYYAEVRNGINGTVVASADFARPSGTTSFYDAQSNAWTVAGGTFAGSATYPLFDGYVDSWAPSYPAQGRDAICEVQATDLFKILANIKLDIPCVRESLLDSPTAYYRFNESEGPAATDSSGNGHNATYTATGITYGQPDPVTDDADGAILLDGSTGYVLAPSSAGVSGTGGFTVAAWIKTTSTDDEPIIVQQPTFNDPSFNVRLLKNASQKAYFEVVEGGIAGIIGGTTNINDGAWHFIVGVRESGGTMRLYIDGTQEATGTSAANLTAYPVWIGGGGLLTSPYFSGSLDEAAIYPTALSATRVSAHYAARTAGADERTDARVSRIAEYALLPTNLVSTNTGLSFVSSAGNFDQKTALDALRDTDETEAGALFTSRDGILTFLSRKTPLGAATRSTASQVTFGNLASSGEIGYTGLTLSSDEQDLATEISVTRRVPGSVIAAPSSRTFIAVDAAQRTKYGTLSYSANSVSNLDTEAQSHAQWLLGHLQPSQLRIRSAEFALTSANDAYLIPRELHDRVTVKWSPPGGGARISQEALITGIEWRASAGDRSWDCALEISPTETRKYWRLGTVGYSELGTSTRLAF